VTGQVITVDGRAEHHAVNAPRPEPEAALRGKQARQAFCAGWSGQAIADYDMISAGDRVMVCLSGGKRQLCDARCPAQSARATRRSISKSSPSISIQRHPGYPAHVLPDYLTALGVPYRIEVAGHLFGGEARDPGRQDHVLAVFPVGGAACCIASRRRSARRRSRSGTIATTSLETFFF